MENINTVTPDVDGLSRKVWRWIKDVRVSPSDGNALMGGVTPLKGRRGMSGAMPCDSGEAQGLRIDIMKSYEAQTPITNSRISLNRNSRLKGSKDC